MYSLEHLGEGKTILLPKWAALTYGGRGACLALHLSSVRGTLVSHGRVRHDGAITVRPLKSQQTGTSEGTLTTMGKGARPSLTPGARCWLGTLP